MTDSMRPSAPDAPRHAAGRPPTPGGRREAPAPTARRRGWTRRWIPPQHGAWAMLLIPYVAGLITVGFAWPDVPLLIAWVGGYLLSYFALLAVKTRRLDRYRTQIAGYGTTVLAAGAVVLAARPRLLAFAPLFAVVFAVNGLFAARRDDRALTNGLVSAAAATLVLPVVAVVAGVSPWRTGSVLVVTLLYFAGTVLFVKTCIRERDNTSLFAVSAGYHVAALAVVTWLNPIYAVPFAGYLCRAIALRRYRVGAKRIGFIELGGSLLLLLAVALAT